MEIFIEESRLGRVIYELSADHLAISGKRLLTKFAMKVPLSDVSLNVVRQSQRFYQPVILLCGIGILLFVVPLKLYLLDLIPKDFAIPLLIAVGLWSIAFLRAGIRSIFPLEGIGFKSTLGETLFVMIKEKEYAEEFEVFVEKVRQNIRRCKEPGRTSWPATPVVPTVAPKIQEHWWKLSLALGIIAVVQPWIKPLAEWLYAGQFFVSFVCCTGGLGFCVASFIKKERFRYLSILGGILSFIPPLCY